MITKFRILRLNCCLQLREVAAEANITPQRLSQIETGYYGARPQDPERLVRALEKVLEQRKKEITDAEYICKHNRNCIFDYEIGDEKL